MRGFDTFKPMCKLLLLILVMFTTAGCAEIPIRDGELVIGKDTTAGIEDVGIARIANKF